MRINRQKNLQDDVSIRKLRSSFRSHADEAALKEKVAGGLAERVIRHIISPVVTEMADCSFANTLCAPKEDADRRVRVERPADRTCSKNPERQCRITATTFVPLNGFIPSRGASR